ncbi:glycoside hydrolase family 43 protein [Novosphingobium kaempferiae]|uniref:glycoside hydrolase family 43 protein n=1 Tax=Novosphingobium kaempferiae TaxID=2896849 RepID=UPI001E5022C6|nr:glycoside hydrolase family 43 protein [Novosphingobium kaempferiae]
MKTFFTASLAAVSLAGCAHAPSTGAATDAAGVPSNADAPLVTEIFTADPSAHVFDGRFYVYPSHDIEGPPLPDVAPFLNSQGNAFRMRDYRVLSMDHVGGPVTLHPVALDIDDVPWAARQMWAPDAAFKNGTYYLYFPAKDRQGAFRIGVATSSTPAGPFTARPEPIKGSFSIDPSVFTDDDGRSYMYFGGLSGGQLQKTVNGVFNSDGPREADRAPHEPAYAPMVAPMTGDMLEYAAPPRAVEILDSNGAPIRADDAERRFFEAAWMHKYRGKYYLSYSTGGTHYIVYATGDSPVGPFTFQGRILEPVTGWTTHHSIVQKDGKWWLFYADSQLSGKTWLRNVRVAPLEYDAAGRIVTIDRSGRSK